MDSSPPPRQPFSCGLMSLLALIILAALVAFVFWRFESWPLRTAREGSAELERLAGKMRDAFVDLAQLQPRVTINDRVFLEQTTAVAELALVSRRMEVDHEFLHTWAGSTKRVKLRGSFNVKAGFDLRQNLTVNVLDTQIAVQLPHATILTVEQEKVEVLEFQNGYWNKISAEELEQELAALPELAREKAEQADLPAEAETTLREQLQQRIGDARPVTLVFTPETPPKS